MLLSICFLFWCLSDSRLGELGLFVVDGPNAHVRFPLAAVVFEVGIFLLGIIVQSVGRIHD